VSRQGGAPLDPVLIEVKLGNAVSDPVEELQVVGIRTIRFPHSERCSGRNSASPTPAASLGQGMWGVPAPFASQLRGGGRDFLNPYPALSRSGATRWPVSLLVAGLRATATPARHPGAFPPRGGRIESASRPLLVTIHEITEFEFHISPVESSSRPQTGVGTCGTISTTSRAQRSLSLSRCGLSTASAMSGILPPRHSRISYLNMRNRLTLRLPTGPSATTPRALPLRSGTGACSTT
jgi:hypothetical protein